MGRKTKAAPLEGSVELIGMRSGDATIMIASSGDFSASGTAKRGPDDKNFYQVGELLAQARALESFARKLRRAIKDFM